MRNVLIALLSIIAVVMLVLGGMKGMLPPMLTGVGFLVIAGILLMDGNKKA